MMKKALFIFLSIFISITIVSSTPGSAEVLLNEFMADPARDWDGDGEYNYRNDEWVEIINTGDSAVDLSGYLLRDGNEETLWRYQFAGMLQSGEVRVIFGSDSRIWEEANGFPIYGLSLNNSGDKVSLFRVSGGDTLLIDSVDYGDSAAEDDRSVGREPEEAGGWELFDAYNPCPECTPVSGNGCVPTPGSVNTYITGTEETSWGKIKSIYK
jgi:PAS domain-containing protein